MNYFKKTIFPVVFLSVLTGAFTGVLIFIFKLLSKHIIDFSEIIYGTVREEPRYFILLIAAVAFLSIVSFVIVSYAPGCRGGGIPTAITVIRGHIRFDWITNMLGMFGASLITFVTGVPLGNEGPSVQMGCAVGKGTVHMLSGKNRNWDRYIMTGGASAGFGAATGTTLSAIIFAFEEVHKRISPIILMTVATAVLTSKITLFFLCDVFGTSFTLFDFSLPMLPLKFFVCALIIGWVSGLTAILFSKSYECVDNFMNNILSRIHGSIKFVIIFMTVAVFGIFNGHLIGSGHDIITEIITGQSPVWYMILLYLFLRAFLLLFANTAGVTGGIFIPSLAFGAMIGYVTSKIMVSVGIMPQKYISVAVVIAMTAFLASSSKIPLTAIAFSIEALCGLSNIIPISLGTAVAYIIIEMSGTVSVSDAVIDGKIRNENKGRQFRIMDAHFTVTTDSFAFGKEIRDILLPPNCIIASLEKTDPDSSVLRDGDVLHIKCKTYNVDDTYFELESLFGKQKNDGDVHYVHKGDKKYALPEIYQ